MSQDQAVEKCVEPTGVTQKETKEKEKYPHSHTATHGHTVIQPHTVTQS